MLVSSTGILVGLSNTRVDNSPDSVRSAKEPAIAVAPVTDLLYIGMASVVDSDGTTYDTSDPVPSSFGCTNENSDCWKSRALRFDSGPNFTMPPNSPALDN